MKQSSDLPKICDVITSEKFAMAYQNSGYDYISIYGEGSQFLCASTNRDKDDPSRGIAEFVVLKAGVEGTEDDYSHYVVKARRLNVDGSYNPEGEVIGFNMWGSVYGIIDNKYIKIIGKMKKIVTYQRIK